MNQRYREIITHLKTRGRVATTDGQTVYPPIRQYPTIPEEIINFLNEIQTELTPKEIANFLGLNIKSVNKSLTKMFKVGVTRVYMNRKRKGKSYYYSCNLPRKTDVTSAYATIISSKDNPIYVLDKPKEETETSNFPGVVLFERNVRLTVGIDHQGQLKTTLSPL